MENFFSQDFYDRIVDEIYEKTSIPTGSHRSLTDYESLAEEIEERYFEHPSGPYQGDRATMKQDKEYLSQHLMERTRRIPYHGKAIQKAIDDTAAAGGGRVEIPAGTWYTGALVLKSKVELHLDDGARLCFVRNKTNEYYPMRFSRWEGVECMNFSPFIYADGEEDISITGMGTIDGMADEFNWMPWKFGYFGETAQEAERQRLFKAGADGVPVEQRIFSEATSTLRPPFIQFYRCRNIRIEGVHVANSPFWEINPVLCENILVKGVHIETNLYNNDGVDPESCKNVLIEDCFFLTGDDCIAIKSGRNEDGRRIAVPTENVIIRNNVFANGHGGITLGSEISGGVQNVYAIGNRFDSPLLDYPIRFKTNAMRGGTLKNVYVKDSVVNKSRLAVVHADFFYEEGHEGGFLPHLFNVTLEDFHTADDCSTDAKYAFYLHGFEDAPIENFTFRNVHLTGVQGAASLANVRNLTYENVTINGHKEKDGTVNIDSCGQIV